jgi:hypothetical protein
VRLNWGYEITGAVCVDLRGDVEMSCPSVGRKRSAAFTRGASSMTNRFLTGLVAVGLITSAVSTAKADYTIEVTTGAFDTGQINFTSPFALATSTAGQVTVDVGALNAFLTGSGFSFVTLGGSSNALSPGKGLMATLIQAGSVLRDDTSASTGTITIVAMETGYNFPTGTPKTMSSAAADTFLDVPITNTRTFQSTFNDGAITVSTVLQTFSPTDPLTDATRGTATTPAFPGLSSFTLTSTTVITLSQADPGSVRTDQFSGTTTVRAVPEPGSFALILLGGTVVAVGYRRRTASV